MNVVLILQQDLIGKLRKLFPFLTLVNNNGQIILPGQQMVLILLELLRWVEPPVIDLISMIIAMMKKILFEQLDVSG